MIGIYVNRLAPFGVTFHKIFMLLTKGNFKPDTGTRILAIGYSIPKTGSAANY